MKNPPRSLASRSKKIAIVFLAVMALVSPVFWLTQSDNLFSANISESKMLRHVVQFQFKATSSEADVQRVVDAFRALTGKISEIADFEHGSNNSPEGLNDGFTHCFLVTFASEKDRKVYLDHADHQAFVSVLKPHLEKVQVIDYWAAK
jgi:hypothetical protein